MALLRRFLKHSHTIYLKPSFTPPLKPLAALLHTHGSTNPQGLTPMLFNPPELPLQPNILLDLPKKYGHLNPKSHHYSEKMVLKILEQCNTQNKLLEEECGNQKKVLEGSESQVLGIPTEGTKIWADSVKKKRRKKMNKHKYKKLRKRLRRKTK